MYVMIGSSESNGTLEQKLERVLESKCVPHTGDQTHLIIPSSSPTAIGSYRKRNLTANACVHFSTLLIIISTPASATTSTTISTRSHKLNHLDLTKWTNIRWQNRYI